MGSEEGLLDFETPKFTDFSTACHEPDDQIELQNSLRDQWFTFAHSRHLKIEPLVREKGNTSDRLSIKIKVSISQSSRVAEPVPRAPKPSIVKRKPSVNQSFCSKRSMLESKHSNSRITGSRFDMLKNDSSIRTTRSSSANLLGNRFTYEPMVNSKELLKYIEYKMGKKWGQMTIKEKQEANALVKTVANKA